MATLKMGSTTWVLLNSDRVVQEIISKRANITGERPDLPIASGLISRYKRTVLRQTKEWADGRKVMHHLLNGTAVRGYAQIQESESLRLLVNYLQEPDHWYKHHFLYAYSIIHRIVAGEDSGHSLQHLNEMQRVTAEFLGNIFSCMVDSFPFLTKLPKFLQPWRKRREAMGMDHFAVFKSWWAPIRLAIATGTAPSSFIKDVLLKDPKFSKNEEETMYLATSIISAGSDNMRRTINIFVMAAICHPGVIQKAREEIEGVCGRSAERLPNLGDIERLPYVLGLIKETIRWRPPVPLIPHHRLTEDLEFEGYSFPAGTDFVVNSLAVCGDCIDPAEFKPERWLNGKEDNIVAGLWQFGGGRRLCVGYKIAQQELFLAYSRLIYCFDLAAVS